MDAASFSADYTRARQRFLRAAETRGARLSSFPIDARGPAGEELALDVAVLGPRSARRLLVVTSGIHGVEGHAGSALQLQLLSAQLDGLDVPADMSLVLIHAINPYGFAHTRRVNENNVDLNRNFLRHPEDHAANADYDRLYDAINPRQLDEETDLAGRATMLAFAQEHGFAHLQHVLTCGQYRHPQGVQFGGRMEQPSNRLVRGILRENRGEAEAVAWLDVHTGLGAFAACELVSQHTVDSTAYVVGRRWFGEAVRTTLTGESASARLFGDMLDGAVAELGEVSPLVPFAPEFGTYDGVRIFQAMRADNWLHQYGDLESEQGRAIKAELREVFCPADVRWREAILARGAEVIGEAVAGLAAVP